CAGSSLIAPGTAAATIAAAAAARERRRSICPPVRRPGTTSCPGSVPAVVSVSPASPIELEAMHLALADAAAAGQRGDVPVGAAVVVGDRVVAHAGNE